MVTVVIGTGPAGVSAALPLAEAALEVILIDGGNKVADSDLREPYQQFRRDKMDQASAFIGPSSYAIRNARLGSPKFGVPNLAACFASFHDHYGATTDGFQLIGSLSSGGLSNAWGAGVSALSDTEAADWPINWNELKISYDRVTSRIGVHGSQEDALAPIFGDMHALQPPPPLHPNAQYLLKNAEHRTTRLKTDGVRLGRARNAVITVDAANRRGCDLKATCLYGCSDRSIYSSRYDLESLLTRPNVTYRALRVTSIEGTSSGYRIHGRSNDAGNAPPVAATNLILAAGTVGSTALALGLMKSYGRRLRLLTTPRAAFAVLIPRRLGQPHPDRDFALAQLSISVELGVADCGPAFGNIFSTTGLGLNSFVQRSPLARPASLRLMSLLSPAMLVGNCFLPGEVSDNSLSLSSSGGLHASGRITETQLEAFAELKRRLARTMRRLGAVLLPASFSIGVPGSDAHYASTLPMRSNPEAYQTNKYGELAGYPGLHVVDGAVLPNLPAKAHTLTIMANADRIGRFLAQRLTRG